MSEVQLLLGLLVLSYVGSILVGDRTIRGFGLPSGAEYLLLGFVLGPHAPGVLTRSTIQSFEPVLVAGAAWIALVAGIGYGQVGRRAVRVGRAIAGALLALFVAAGVFGAIFGVLGLIGGFSLRERYLLSLAAGTVCSETTRHAVRWVVERHGAKGHWSDVLADHARASVLVPALAISVLFAAAPGQGLPLLTIEARAALTPAIGCVLGLVAALLPGREFRRDESWGIFLGTSLLGIGVASRLGLSAITTTFAMGLALGGASPHRADLKAMIAPTEKPVMLPVIVLAGASVNLRASDLIPALVGVAVGTRLVMELLRGALSSAWLRRRGPTIGALGGLGMTPTGAFTLACAVAIQFRLPAPLGAIALSIAAASVLTGELIGPLMLRRALIRAQNIIPGQSQTPPPPSVAPGRPSMGDYP